MINAVIPDYSTRKFRRRPPRLFGEDELIIPYNYDHAVGNEYVKKLGYKMKENEQFKYVDQAHFKVNGSSHTFALIVTDCRLYIIIVKEYDVEKYCRLKLHTIKKVKLTLDETDDGQTTVDIFTHVTVQNSKTLIHLT